MAEKPNRLLPTKVADRVHAPIVFFDTAPVSNNHNGIIGVTLSVNLSVPDGNGSIAIDQVVSAYLRGNIQAFNALRAAIDSAILLGAKTDGEAN
jgi:hypothetical protein